MVGEIILFLGLEANGRGFFTSINMYRLERKGCFQNGIQFGSIVGCLMYMIKI